MATKRKVVSRTKGATGSDSGVTVGPSTFVFTNAGAPSNGAAGIGAEWAGKGSLCIDTTNGTLYQNTGTKASPTWTAR